MVPTKALSPCNSSGSCTQCHRPNGSCLLLQSSRMFRIPR
jgi:hypothetical protein